MLEDGIKNIGEQWTGGYWQAAELGPNQVIFSASGKG